MINKLFPILCALCVLCLIPIWLLQRRTCKDCFTDRETHRQQLEFLLQRSFRNGEIIPNFNMEIMPFKRKLLLEQKYIRMIQIDHNRKIYSEQKPTVAPQARKMEKEKETQDAFQKYPKVPKMNMEQVLNMTRKPLMVSNTQKAQVLNSKKQVYYGRKLRPIFQRWTEITEKLEITYFLTAGTLIGSYLNRDVLPEDSDMDALMGEKDLPKLIAMRDKRDGFDDFNETENRFRLILQKDWHISDPTKRRRFACDGRQVNEIVDCCSFQDPVGRLVYNSFYLDIFSFKTNKTTVSNLIDNKTLNKHEVFPLQSCQLMDLTTFCPRNTELFLKTHYGEKLFESTVGQFSNSRMWKD